LGKDSTEDEKKGFTVLMSHFYFNIFILPSGKKEAAFTLSGAEYSRISTTKARGNKQPHYQ